MTRGSSGYSLTKRRAGPLDRAVGGRPAEGPGGEEEGQARPRVARAATRVRPHPHGALIALGSGSSDKRNHGCLISLGPDKLPAGAPTQTDLGPLYANLKKEISDLNIEGVAALETTLRIFQRGNNGSGRNASIDLDLEEVQRALDSGDPIPPSAVLDIRTYDLGKLKGVNLSFSDASVLDDGRIAFTASAEDSKSNYDDGETVGSAIGVMATDGEVILVEEVDQNVKLEGLWAEQRDDEIRLLMVTDADDPSKPSPLLEATMPAPG